MIHSKSKSVGIVTTARVTHATPGAAYAKIPHREWETDADMVAPWYGRGGRNCDSSLKDIARQLVEDNHRIHVVMGGGRRCFLNNKTMDPVHNLPGKRADGRNLIKTWEARQEAKGARYQYVWNREQLQEVDDNVEYLLGLFDYSHMAFDADRYERGKWSQPSLSDMTEKAIRILRKNEKGYFLFVEGAAIDLAHHQNLAHKSLLEGIAMDRAVKTATDLTSEVDTLTMVTADHSHVFNIAGYPVRGHSILGKMDNSNEDYWYMPTDGKMFTTIHYANGPGPNRSLDLADIDTRKLNRGKHIWDTPRDGLPMTTVVYGNGPGPGRELDLTTVDTTALDFQFPAAVPIAYETHGGEDVSIYAQGPMSHLVSGNWEQHFIAHLMAYAACVGPDKSHCTEDGRESSDFCNGAIQGARAGKRELGFALMVVIAFVRYLL
ncbi:hypothetical protein RRG08_018811 [Elysia crispata]|uniref:alkaline phosphatase n=1 Tax=Elysia crispata TaxID=231223 RepID=A0AAE0ZSV2_9GAST|nr:hypothetical protein RRG08_018811 [Elysia crispata]